jgi:uncharacterized protein
MSTPGARSRPANSGARRWGAALAALAALVVARAVAPSPALAQALPALIAPVNDTAGVIDPPSAAAMDRMIRALLAASGDVVIVATVPTIAPYADAREYAVKLFENGGRGIGNKGKDNGLLVLLAVKERQVRVEVGYDLEPIITDGFSGETSRETMVPFFRQGEYGQGLLAGVHRLIGRIAAARGVTLQDLPAAPVRTRESTPSWVLIILVAYFALVAFRTVFGFGNARRRGRWGGGGWSGWSGGVGGFGGGSSGGFGGGFGGFGGGSSGGGGGGASW